MAEAIASPTSTPQWRTAYRRVVGGGSLLAKALAGPALIVGAVLILLHAFAFSGLITNQYEDLLPYWLPNYCFLGRSLASGTIPLINPTVLGGVPFAANPQTGWMNLPVMSLFSTLPCDAAMRWYIVLLPVIAGMGMFWFLRTEGTSRAAATCAGLVIALVIADSWLALSVPFSGAVAWTCVLLAVVARYLRATTWSGRLAWVIPVALAWGQLATVHLSDGLVLGTLAAVAYAVPKLVRAAAHGRRALLGVLLSVVLVVVAVPLVNLATLLPRLTYLPRTTLSLGYQELLALAATLRGHTVAPELRQVGLPAAWPFTLTTWPGSYISAAALVLSGAAFWARRRLSIAVTFAAFGAVCYAVSLRGVASWGEDHLGFVPLIQFYLHNPIRFRYGVLIALAVLAGLGLEAWTHATGVRDRVLMVTPGVLLWWLGSFVVRPAADSAGPIVAGIAVASLVLAAVVWRRRLVALVPIIIAGEMVWAGLAGQRVDYVKSGPTDLVAGTGGVPQLYGPGLSAAAYLDPGPIAEALRAEGDRFVSLAPSQVDNYAGYIRLQRSSDWGLLANDRSTVFGLQDAQGYDPVQPLRLWEYMRTVGDGRAKYNLSFFKVPSPQALDLFDVGWVVGPRGDPPLRGLVPIVGEGAWELYRRPGAASRASVVTDWAVASSARAALSAVTGGSFDPEAQVILERSPGLDLVKTNLVGTATYGSVSPEEAIVQVSAPGPAVVLIRNTYDPGWSATVDGRPAAVLVADSFLQGVPVPPGRHRIVLTYRDQSVILGLEGSAASLGVLVAGSVSLAVWRRRRRSAG